MMGISKRVKENLDKAETIIGLIKGLLYSSGNISNFAFEDRDWPDTAFYQYNDLPNNHLSIQAHVEFTRNLKNEARKKGYRNITSKTNFFKFHRGDNLEKKISEIFEYGFPSFDIFSHFYVDMLTQKNAIYRIYLDWSDEPVAVNFHTFKSSQKEKRNVFSAELRVGCENINEYNITKFEKGPWQEYLLKLALSIDNTSGMDSWARMNFH